MELSSYISIYRFPPERTVFAARQVKDRAKNDSRIVQYAQEVIDQGENAMDLLGRWQMKKSSKAKFDDDARKWATAIDRNLTALYKNIQTYVQAFPEEDELHIGAQKILKRVFPYGVGEFIHQPWIEKVESFANISSTIREDFQDELNALSISSLLDRFDDLLEKFKQSVLSLKENLSWDDIQKAKARTHESLCRLIVVILGTYPDESEEHRSKRAFLMAPIDAQNEAMAAQFKRSSKTKEVEEKEQSSDSQS